MYLEAMIVLLQELDKQIDALKIKQKEQKDAANEALQTNLEFGRVKILQNNEQRTQYTPTIKLLKRDPVTSESTNQASMGDRKPSYKSLQQREQEYAEARKRILGSAEEQNGTSEVSPTNASPQIAQRFVYFIVGYVFLFMEACYSHCTVIVSLAYLY